MKQGEKRYIAAGGVFPQGSGMRGSAGHISPEMDKRSSDLVVEKNVTYLFGTAGLNGLEVKGSEGTGEGLVQCRRQVNHKHCTR